MTNTLTPLLTIKEVMAIFKVQRQQPYRWHKAGILKAVVLPTGSMRWRQCDLEAFMNGVAVQEGGAK